MDEGRPSATAINAAMIRAAHLLWDDDPKILRDPLALGLSGVADETALRAALEALQAEQGKTLEQRVAQYVILVALLGSFAYPRPDVGGVLRIFAVDHRATQQLK